MDPALLSALQLVHNPNPSIPQSERIAAQELLTSFEQDVSRSVPAGLQLSSHAQPEIRHFGLHLLDAACTQHYASLSSSQQQSLKQSTLSLVAPAQPQQLSAHWVREKVAKLVLHLARRDFPQRWPDLLAHLHAAAGKSPESCTTALIVFRDLSDDIREFSPFLPERRRREILAGLREAAANLTSFAAGVLRSSQAKVLQLQQQQQPIEQHTAPLLAAVRALSSFLHFLPEDVILAHRVIPALGSLLNVPEAFAPIAEGLLRFLRRKHSSLSEGHHAHLQTVWGLVLQLIHSVITAREPSPEAGRLDRLFVILSTLIKSHAQLGRPLADQTFAALGAAMQQPRLRTRSRAVEIWIAIMRETTHSMITNDEALLKVLMPLIVTQSPKPPHDAQPPPDEFPNIGQYRQAFGGYRSFLLQLTSYAVQRRPDVCLATVVPFVAQLLTSPIDPADVRAAPHGFLTLNSTRYLQLEGTVAVLERVVREISDQGHVSHDALRPLFQQLVQLCLDHKPSDPLITGRVLYLFACLAPFISTHVDLLQRTLDYLLHAVLYRMPDETSLPDLELLGEDTVALRRRSIYSLLTYCKFHSAAVLPLFQTLMQRVNSLISQRLVSSSEQVLLSEALVGVSTALQDPAQQHNFVRQMVADAVQRFTSAEVLAVLQDPAQLMRLVTPSSDALAAHVTFRNQIFRDLNLFLSVFRCVPLRLPDVAVHPSARILIDSVMPNVLRLCGTLDTIWTPPGVAEFQRAGLADLLEPITSVTKEQIGQGDAPVPDKSHPVYASRRWLLATRVTAYTLAALGTSVGVYFYQTVPPQVLMDTIFHHPVLAIQHMPYEHLRAFYDKFAVDFFSNCPPAAVTAIAVPLLEGLCCSALARLSQGWARVQAPAADSNEQAEILQEKSLRDFSRSFYSFLSQLFQVPIGDAGMAAGAKAAAAPPVPPKLGKTAVSQCVAQGILSMGPGGRVCANSPADQDRCRELLLEAVLSKEGLCRPLFLLISGCICWPDSVSCGFASSLCFHLIANASSRAHVHPFIGEVLRACLHRLSELPAEVIEKVHIDLMYLVKEIYSTIGRASDIPRSVLGSIPGVMPQHLLSLEEVMTHESERAQRKAFRAFLTECILGKQRASSGATAAVSDLPTQLVLHSEQLMRRISDETPQWSQSFDTVALQRLFT